MVAEILNTIALFQN